MNRFMRWLSGLLLAVLLTTASSAFGAVTFDTSATSGPAAGTGPFTFNITIGSGLTNVAVAVLVTYAGTGAGTTTVTVDGTAAPLVTGTDIAVTVRSGIYCAPLGTRTGSRQVSVTLTSSDTIAIAAVSASGVDQATPCIHGTGHDFNSGPTDILTITSAVGNLSFDVATNNTGSSTDFSSPTQTTGAPPSGFYAEFISQFTTNSAGSRATTPAASVDHTWTKTATNFGTHSGADFLAAASGAAGPLTGGDPLKSLVGPGGLAR